MEKKAVEPTEMDIDEKSCADDVDVLKVIEKCYGVRPMQLSKHFIDRRPTAGQSASTSTFVKFALLQLSN